MDVPCCSWCSVIAPGTRTVAGYFKPRRAEEAQQSPGLLKYSTLCEKLIHSVTFLKYHLGNHQIPESQTKVIKYLYRQAQAINKLFWIASHDWLSILLVLPMGQVSAADQGMTKYPKFTWSVLLQHWTPPYTPGQTQRKELGRKWQKQNQIKHGSSSKFYSIQHCCLLLRQSGACSCSGLTGAGQQSGASYFNVSSILSVLIGD